MFIFANNRQRRQTKQTMRKSAAILIGLWVICMTCATSICAATVPNKLDTLKVFIKKKKNQNRLLSKACSVGKTQIYHTYNIRIERRST